MLVLQGAALAGLLTPVALGSAQLTGHLMSALLLFEFLATAYLVGLGGMTRAIREDRSVWLP